MRSWKTPTPKQVESAIGLLTHPEQARYFFDRLENPTWIAFLEARRVFAAPPAPIGDPASGYMHPLWPESRYLVRMAEHAPQDVANVLLRLPETDNFRVHEDIVDAALKLPPALSASIARAEQRWISKQRDLAFLLPEKIGALGRYLAREGEARTAIKLSRALFAVFPAEGASEGSATGYPRGRFDSWEYQEILRQSTADLAVGASTEAVALFADLLETAVRITLHGDAVPPEDFSYVWRPAIEAHEQNSDDGIVAALVEAVRDASVRVAADASASVETLLGVLGKHRWRVFDRLALHLLRMSRPVQVQAVAARLLDPELLTSASVRHEYALLARETWEALPGATRESLLERIVQGPEPEDAIGSEADVVAAERSRNLWVRNTLAPLSDLLPPLWRQRYETLVSELGEPDHPTFPVYSSGMYSGSASPKSAQELASMNVEQLVAFLRSWDWPQAFLGPTPSGLGSALSTAVESKPMYFAESARMFRGLAPNYVRGLVTGLRRGLKQGGTIRWDTVLELCCWVVEQPRELIAKRAIPAHSLDDIDHSWGPTRREISDLLAAAVGSTTSFEIPFAFRGEVWRVLHVLLADPDPRADDEINRSPETFDPWISSINTVRAQALHATMAYALWCRRHLDPETVSSDTKVACDFSRMPEVRIALEDGLNDPTRAVRAVYGQWFPWLYLLDPSWTEGQVSQIFPPNEAEMAMWLASWTAYVRTSPPYSGVVPLLRDDYARAVDRIAVVGRQFRGDDSNDRLAEHLFLMYWYGKLQLAADSLLGRFLSVAPPDLRNHMAWFGGRLLNDAKDALPADATAALKLYWESRIAAAENSASSESFREEVAAFGWWFASGQFEPGWSLAMLLRTVRIAPVVKPVGRVFERLATMAETHPEIIVECLEAMLIPERTSRGLFGWESQLRWVFSSVLNGKDEGAKARARLLMERLGQRGQMGFRDLARVSR